MSKHCEHLGGIMEFKGSCRLNEDRAAIQGGQGSWPLTPASIHFVVAKFLAHLLWSRIWQGGCGKVCLQRCLLNSDLGLD
jgi:hypothetical protein